MSEGAQGIHRFAVEQYVHLDKAAGAEAVLVIIEGCIALADALELVVEVNHYLTQGHGILYLHTVTADVLLLEQFASLAQAQRHDGADVGCIGDDSGSDVRFLYMVDEGSVGHTRGVVHLLDLSLLVIDEIRHVGDGGDDVHVELTIEPLLHYLHMKKSQEAASETEAKRHGALGSEGEAGIVEL